MRDVVLSILPRWAEFIYSGRKTVEWHHTYPEGAGAVFLYECDSVRRIGVTGVMHIGDIREVDARSVPKDLLERGCVSREDLLAYQWGRKLYAWEILRAERIPDPLADFRYWKAPRSWCYVEDVEVCDRRQW